jgi:hypothetical protein
VSVASLTTIAAIRETAASGQGPTKREIGKVPPAHPKAGERAGVTDVLAKQIPTELIAPYTALTAAIVGAIAKPSKKNPSPDQLAGWRWAAFALLVGSVILLVWWGKQQKTGTWTFPLIPVVAGVVSAVFWAFLMPGSPLVPYLHSKHAKEFLPLFMALGGTVVAVGAAALLTTPKR